MSLRLGRFLVCFGCVLLIAADSAQSQQQPGFERMGTLAGVGRYSRHRWGIVAVELTNPTDAPVDLLVTTYLEKDAGRQFARQFWVPPHAKRNAWYPVLPSRSLHLKQPTIQAHSLLIDRTGENEIIRRRSDEQMLHSSLLPGFNQDLTNTGLLSAATQKDDEGNDLTLEGVVCLRLARRLSRSVIQLNQRSLPAMAEAWQAIDLLVLADDRITDDVAALLAVRRWIYDGGQLWILLDQVSPETVEAIFGDAVEIEVIDRVGLTEVTIESKTDDSPPTQTFDDPVDFVRVIPSEMEVTHTVDGWPAAFWKTMGQGTVLCTTVGPKGWIRLRTDDDETPAVSKYLPISPLEKLADRLFKPPEQSNFELQQLLPPLSDQIGYSIVSRGPVLAVLGIFCTALILANLWFRRNGKLAYLGLAVPPAAIASALTLVFMGTQSTRAVPSTAAEVQLIDAVPGAEDVWMRGLVALFHQQQTAGSLGAKRGGTFQPDLSGLGGTTRRMVWTDLDQWHWENLTLPPGLRATPFRRTTQIDRPITARGTFGPRGFTGRLDFGPFTNPGDAVVVRSSSNRAAVHLTEEGDFTSGPEDLLAPQQFLSGRFVDDVQRRRQEVYRVLFVEEKNAREFDRPTLLFWADPLDTEFSFPEIERHVRSALVHLPLTIERPAAGTEYVVPPPFLNVSVVAGPEDQPGMLSTYDKSRDRWLHKQKAALTWLRFELPPQLLPVEIRALKLTVQINAPSRPLKILGLAGDRVIPIDEKQSPIGNFSFSIKESAAQMLDADGGLTVGIDVGHASDRSNIEWKIASTRLEVHGRSVGP